MYYTTWDMQDSPISAANGNDTNPSTAVAPFVIKTYQMVADPATDHLISWGPNNNSFIVVHPLQFSRLILPSNFKHSNFSSFIRQLNTYGFRKVDPDRWEFANEWFLRGQKHLLKNIIRRKHTPPLQISEQHNQMPDDQMDREIERIRKEQEEMEVEIQGMTKRLETTERRPDQMMEFLCKVVEDPDILPKMILERERRTRQRQICSADGLGDKKRRLIFTPPSSLGAATNSNSGRTTEDDEGSNSLGVATTSSSPEVELISQSSIHETCCEAWFRPIGATASTAGYGDEISGYVGFDCDAPVVELEAEVPPYPFSLLGGGF